MTTKHLLLTTALAGLLAVGQAHAQGSGGGSGGGQQGTTAGQAQGGAQGQRLAQEQAQSQGTPIYISTAGTRQIQQALNKAGYSVGNVDGQWNQETQQAAKNFQQAQGLEPTGTLTVRTVVALGMQDLLTGQNVSQGAGQAQGGAQGQRLAQETAQGEGTPLYVSPAGVRQIQQALNKAGYSVGNVDGQWNQETQQAAKNFSQAQGLEPTGQLDVGLISALGVTGQIFQAGGGGQMAQGGQQGGQAGQAQGGAQGQRLAQETAQGQGTQLYLGPAGVRQLTQALNKAGYAAGNIDGNWDQQTAQAAKNFQQAKGLEPTGTLTTEMMAALGMQNWMQGGGSPTATGGIGQGGGAGGGVGGMGQQQGGGAGAAGQQQNETITITPQPQQQKQ